MESEEWESAENKEWRAKYFHSTLHSQLSTHNQCGINTLMSTFPRIPGTLPLLVHCHISTFQG